MARRTRRRANETAEEAVWLLDGGVPACQVAARLGYKNPKSLARTLAGWPQLAARFGRKFEDPVVGVHFTNQTKERRNPEDGIGPRWARPAWSYRNRQEVA